jgi:succinate-semialdehyde dehydrogenase/glutarate-semialdehyde dehydrogenase
MVSIDTGEDAVGAVRPSERTGLFIGGRWEPSDSGETFAVTNPASGVDLARVAEATVGDGVLALEAAAAAADSWAATVPRERSDILRRALDACSERADEFAELITSEMGKPLSESYAEVRYGAEFLRWYSEEAVRISGRSGLLPEGSGSLTVQRRPVGPCLLITPWNFPLAMATRKIAPALAAGCTAVIKPAELTPLTTLLLTEVLHEAGLPVGVLNVVTTTQPGPIVDRLMADPRLRKVSFTGSTGVGRHLLSQAAGGVLRTSMELGGNAPFIVLDDAYIPAAVEGAVSAKFRNGGQACTAANRFIVHESLSAEFAEALAIRVRSMPVGSGLDPEVTVGPLINQAAVDKAARLVDDAVARGAKLLAGGRALDGPGTFFEPTVLAGVAPESLICSEEIFGPVVAIVSAESDEDAVRQANDTEFGLVAYVYSRDLGRAQKLSSALEVGMVGVNVGTVSNAAAPFGGLKHSGLGREGGSEGIEEYLAIQYTVSPA